MQNKNENSETLRHLLCCGVSLTILPYSIQILFLGTKNRCKLSFFSYLLSFICSSNPQENIRWNLGYMISKHVSCTFKKCICVYFFSSRKEEIQRVGGKMETESSTHWFTPPMAAARIPEPHPGIHVVLLLFSGSWIRSGALGNPTGAHKECWCHRQRLKVPCHNAGPLLDVYY